MKTEWIKVKKPSFGSNCYGTYSIQDMEVDEVALRRSQRKACNSCMYVDHVDQDLELAKMGLVSSFVVPSFDRVNEF